MTEYLVVEKQNCTTCGGTGVVSGAEWAEFWAAHNFRPGENINHPFHDTAAFTEAIKKWRIDTGINLESPRYPEEEPCIDCCGRGFVCREVSLAETEMWQALVQRLKLLEMASIETAHILSCQANGIQPD